VMTYIETSRYEQRPYHKSGIQALDYPTNDTRAIVQAAQQIVERVYRPGYLYSKAGVGCICKGFVQSK
jgi:DNA polymerase V